SLKRTTCLGRRSEGRFKRAFWILARALNLKRCAIAFQHCLHLKIRRQRWLAAVSGQFKAANSGLFSIMGGNSKPRLVLHSPKIVPPPLRARIVYDLRRMEAYARERLLPHIL